MTFEHPSSAYSWHTPQLEQLGRAPEVTEVTFDVCAYGPDEFGHLFKKPTKVLGLRTPWLSRLARRCPGHHAHFRLKGSWTARAAKYVPALVEVWAAEAARAFHSTFADLADEDVLVATPEDTGASLAVKKASRRA